MAAKDEQEQAAQTASTFDAAIARAQASGVQAIDSPDHGEPQPRSQASAMMGEARELLGVLADEGKEKACGALAGLSRVIDENAALVDEKFGPRYGDYARNASRSIDGFAHSLEEKSLDDLGDDVRAAIRSNPAMAVGLAAVAGFVVARLIRR